MGSLPGLSGSADFSDADIRLHRIKRELVLNLFLQQGKFWQAIRGLREKWSIDAPVGIPERAECGQHVWPRYWGLGPESRDWYTKPEYETQRHLLRDWWVDLDELVYEIIPEPFSSLDYYLDTWRRFLGACVLCDPPETELQRFAAIGEPSPLVHDIPDPQPTSFPMIKQMRDWLLSVQEEHEEMWDVAIKAVERVAPPGVNPQELLLEVMRETWGDPQRSRQQEIEDQNPFRWYIEVDEHATEADVRKAFKMLRVQQKDRPKQGRWQRDPLIAVQAAILHDKHNAAEDAEDRRRRRWTYETLAEHFNLTGKNGKVSARAAKGYVELGRQLLSVKTEPED